MPHLLFLKISNISHIFPSSLSPGATHGSAWAGWSSPAPSCQEHLRASCSTHEHLTTARTPQPPTLASPHPPVPHSGWFSPGTLPAVFVLLENSLSRQVSALSPPPLGKTACLGDRPGPSSVPLRVPALVTVPHPHSHGAVSHPVTAVTRCVGSTTPYFPKAWMHTHTGDSETPPAPSSSASLDQENENATHGFHPRSAGLM